jgi:hypothetical protein
MNIRGIVEIWVDDSDCVIVKLNSVDSDCLSSKVNNVLTLINVNKSHHDQELPLFSTPCCISIENHINLQYIRNFFASKI